MGVHVTYAASVFRDVGVMDFRECDGQKMLSMKCLMRSVNTDRSQA